MTLLNPVCNTFSDSSLSLDKFLIDFDLSLNESISHIDEPVFESARFVASLSGKRFRPTLCFLSGYPEADYQDLINASVIVELVHIASLVHDDVLDRSEFRRNKPTIHQKIGINDAILLGDSLFSFALELSTQFEENLVCKIVSHATRKTCSGEIAQNSCIGKFDISIEKYLEIISDKTGCLFGASCKLGGVLSRSDSLQQQILEEIGLSLGVNYQLYDDITDAFGVENVAGKSLGTDFLHHKPTLPVLVLLAEASSSDYEQIIKLFSSPKKSDKEISLISNYLQKYDILNKCVTYFNSKLEKTNLLIHSLSNSETKGNLIDFIGSFSTKVSTINNLKHSNFLAVHS